jgi:flagellin
VVKDVGGIKEAYANIADEGITKLEFAVNSGVTDDKSIEIAKNSDGEVTVTAGTKVTLKELNAALKDYGIQIDTNDETITDETEIGTLSASVELDTDAGNIAIRVDTQIAADKAITIINDALETVSAERSKLGAMQNRLEHTIANLGTSAENLQAAEARIRDLDMAEEIMAFTKNNILQQAATAMLAQANMAPQSVLQLLG